MKITSEPPVLVWFRQDLRCTDNPALVAAAATGRPVVPIFILDEETPGRWRPGAAGRWWLHHSLACLAQSLGVLAGRRAGDFALVLRSGPSERTMRDVIADTGQRRYSGTDVTSLMRSAALSGSWRRSAATASRFAASMPPCCSSRGRCRPRKDRLTARSRRSTAQV